MTIVMKTQIVRLIIVAGFSVFTFQARAFLDESVTVQLKPSESGTIEDLAAKTSMPLKGDVTTNYLLTAPALVKLDGRIPVMLVPVLSGATQVTLNPPMTKDLTAAPKQKAISADVTEVMMAITTIQKDIQKRDVDGASFKLEELRKRYPDVEFLGFIRGSILLLQGQKAQARRAVSRALEANPNYKEGQEFLKALGGPEKDGDHE